VAIRTIIQPTPYISHDPRHLYASVRKHREQVAKHGLPGRLVGDDGYRWRLSQARAPARLHKQPQATRHDVRKKCQTSRAKPARTDLTG